MCQSGVLVANTTPTNKSIPSCPPTTSSCMFTPHVHFHSQPFLVTTIHFCPWTNSVDISTPFYSAMGIKMFKIEFKQKRMASQLQYTHQVQQDVCLIGMENPAGTRGTLNIMDTSTKTPLSQRDSISSCSHSQYNFQSIDLPRIVKRLLSNPASRAIPTRCEPDLTHTSLLVADPGATDHTVPDKSAFIS